MPRIGEETLKGYLGRDRAVVIGGGIVGLLAARVLSDHYFSCTVIEADRLPDSPMPRKGAPQTTQPHILFASGYRIIQELFPGIEVDFATHGALPIDWAREFYRFDRLRGWNATDSAPSEILSVTCSRPLLEWCIRQRVAELDNVTFLEGHHVNGLMSNPEKTRITGVRVQPKGDAIEQEVFADLVVDAGGRFSQTPKWLKDLDIEPPEETVVDPFVGYATRRFRAPNGYKDDWKVLLISQTPPDDKRLGYLAKVENGEWIATLGGFGKDYPPTDDQGFLEFARSLSDPKFYEAIKEAEPTSPVYAYRGTANRLRHYEKMKLPDGFVSLGDAVCALCPVYGQGITQGAQSVIVLRNCLESSRRGKSRRPLKSSKFQEKIARVSASYWGLATGQDLGFSTTKRFPPVAAKPKKKPGLLGKLMKRYFLLLLNGASVDPKLNTLFMKIVHRVESPLIFLHPLVILRVLKTARKQKLIRQTS